MRQISVPNLIIGIDPGTTGALVALVPEEGQPTGYALLYRSPMPTKKIEVRKGNKKIKRQQICPQGIVEWLSRFDPATTIVVIEQVYASPKFKMGVTGAFSFGRGVGMLHGILAALGFKFTEVAPALWKRRAGLLNKKDPKEASRHLAQELWGKGYFFHKKDSDKAEAALLGYYGAIGKGLIND